MNQLPQIEGLTVLDEIGRSALVVGYRAARGTETLVLEVLLTEDPSKIFEFHRTSALQNRLAHPGMPPIQMSGTVDGRYYRVREFVEGRPVSGLFADGPLSIDGVTPIWRLVPMDCGSIAQVRSAFSTSERPGPSVCGVSVAIQTRKQDSRTYGSQTI